MLHALLHSSSLIIQVEEKCTHPPWGKFSEGLIRPNPSQTNLVAKSIHTAGVTNAPLPIRRKPWADKFCLSPASQSSMIWRSFFRLGPPAGQQAALPGSVPSLHISGCPGRPGWHIRALKYKHVRGVRSHRHPPLSKPEVFRRPGSSQLQALGTASLGSPPLCTERWTRHSAEP